jgi:hypothetical protein
MTYILKGLHCYCISSPKGTVNVEFANKSTISIKKIVIFERFLIPKCPFELITFKDIPFELYICEISNRLGEKHLKSLILDILQEFPGFNIVR